MVAEKRKNKHDKAKGETNRSSEKWCGKTKVHYAEVLRDLQTQKSSERVEWWARVLVKHIRGGCAFKMEGSVCCGEAVHLPVSLDNDKQ